MNADPMLLILQTMSVNDVSRERFEFLCAELLPRIHSEFVLSIFAGALSLVTIVSRQ